MLLSWKKLLDNQDFGHLLTRFVELLKVGLHISEEQSAAVSSWGKSVIFHLLNTMRPLLLIESYSIHVYTDQAKNPLFPQK